MFSDLINSGNRCFVVGKVYDADNERYGCVTILSEDVAGVIGDTFLQKTHEEINYDLMCAYMEFRQFCMEAGGNNGDWDDYLRYAVQKHFLPLFKNGVRARLIRPEALDKVALPTLMFILYLKYDEVYC